MPLLAGPLLWLCRLDSIYKSSVDGYKSSVDGLEMSDNEDVDRA